MAHKSHHRKRFKKIQKKSKRLAAAVAGMAVMSALLPGMPAASAHAAAANPTVPNTPTPITQHVSQKDINQAKAPDQTKAPDQAKAPDTAKDTTQAKAPETAKDQTKVQESQQSNAPENYQKVLDIKATAYAPGAHDNDQWGDKTFMGTNVRPGVIAVDPSVIPIGSRVYIQYPDGHGEYAMAEDTGGAIKGNRIDIAKWTVGEAQDFGIQHVKVFVVSSPDTAKA